jgi:hypothetical protein
LKRKKNKHFKNNNATETYNDEVIVVFAGESEHNVAALTASNSHGRQLKPRKSHGQESNHEGNARGALCVAARVDRHACQLFPCG